ncbi:MAG: amino acid permease [Bifidobacteriaceae bacterium]|nr:amino acid permease [Bifidobacteriaceae bacterium]
MAELKRNMEARHLTMISLGGVIGTGLFLSSGYTVYQAGPFGAILAYAIGSVLVYCVMLSLGELSVAMPYAGSFHMYTKKFIGPGSAVVVAILYWLNWAVALASEFTAAGLLMQRWFPTSSAWMWSAVFIAVVFLLNILSVRIYGESEFWFASIKVIAIIAFILIGLLGIFGIMPIHGVRHAYLLTNFYRDGLFPNGIIPVFSTLLTVVFAFSGTEVVGVAAGETKNPEKAVPRAIHTTVLRLMIFFIGSIGVMGALIPWQKAGVDTSPFVLVFQSIGLPFAGDIMNFVILTAVLSAANSGLYVCSRMVWSLGKEKIMPTMFAKANKQGVPVNAVIFSMVGSLLALLSSVFAASTVYLALVAVSGLATLVVWVSVSVCHILFRKQLKQSGKSVDDLAYKAPGYPIVPIVAIILCFVSFILVCLDPEQRSTLYYVVPFVIVCYAIFYIQKRIHDKRGK